MPVSQALSDAYRGDLAALLGLAQGDIDVLFRRITSADDLRDALLDVLPELVGLYGLAATALAADWYDEVREVAEAPGRFRAIPADLPDRGRTDSLARWGVAPLYGGSGPDAARALVSGGFERIISDAGRNTVLFSLTQDPQGIGWERRTSARACDFCKMLAGRGAVYSAATADFGSHDNCGCVAAPVIGRDSRPVKSFTPSQRKKSTSEPSAAPDLTRDVDLGKSAADLQRVLDSLESATVKSPATLARIEDLRRKVRQRR